MWMGCGFHNCIQRQGDRHRTGGFHAHSRTLHASCRGGYPNSRRLWYHGTAHLARCYRNSTLYAYASGLQTSFTNKHGVKILAKIPVGLKALNKKRLNDDPLLQEFARGVYKAVVRYNDNKPVALLRLDLFVPLHVNAGDRNGF